MSKFPSLVYIPDPIVSISYIDRFEMVLNQDYNGLTFYVTKNKNGEGGSSNDYDSYFWGIMGIKKNIFRRFWQGGRGAR